MLQLLIGQVPEALYFSLFIIFTKRLKEKRILFVVLMIIEYLLLKHFIAFNLWFQILYTIAMFLILKMLYKEKAQITDIFTFMIASIIMIVVTVIMYFGLGYLVKDYVALAIISRFILFGLVIGLRNTLPKIQSMYKLMWNRNDKKKKPIKSATFRCINVIAFNAMFYILNIFIILAVKTNLI